MQKIIHYISDLLYLHDNVVVPDFGAFVSHYRSATFDVKSGILHPPHKEISFNPSLTENDGVLESWIGDCEHIDSRKAKIRVSLFVEELKVALNRRQKVNLGNIGEMWTDRKYVIHFRPSLTNFNSEAIGLDDVAVKRKEDTPKLPAKPKEPKIEKQKPITHALPAAARRRTFSRFIGLSMMILLVVSTCYSIYQVLYSDAEIEFLDNPVLNRMSMDPLGLSERDESSVEKCSYTVSPSCDYLDEDPIQF